MVMVMVPALLAAVAPAQEKFTLSENDEWVQKDKLDPSTPEGRLAEIRRSLANGETNRAVSLIAQWLVQFEGHSLTAEAYLLRGDSYRARRDYYKALFDYEYIARVYPASEIFVKALERELEIAKLYAGGLKRKMWGMRIVDASEEAQELLIRVQERMPGSRLAESAGIALGDYYFSRRQMTLAVDAYSLFIENYPRSEHVGKARRRLIFSYLASFKGPEFDAAGLYEARELLWDLQAMEPAAAEQSGADALLVRIDESDAQKMLVTARWYWKTNNAIAAEFTIRKLVKKYPRSVATAEALRLIPDILQRIPDNILVEAPDYQALRGALLGEGLPREQTETPPEGSDI